MKLPLSWLRDYVDFDDTPEGLAEKLTMSGTEVEGIETVGGDFEGIVVGEVLKVDKHPNADKLTLCAVNTGSGEMTVVCGAPNARVGMKAPFAPSGVTLPNGLKLKKAKIRGVESEGMLCAKDELALSDDHTGLMELAEDLVPGTPLAEVLGPPETVLELEVTPNRSDCLSVVGMAREVAALYGTELKWPEIDLPESDEVVEDLTSVEIKDAEGCPRYTARILKNVKAGQAPDWMRRRLELSGVRAISNIVDITNYVMLECGQPLHAFDQALLKEGRIVVRRFAPGEKLSTLDGIERAVDESMLVIADAENPIAIAGVMGGAGSEINDSTETVLLESAYFRPQDNRATSKKLGLSTESSYRFERGVDIERVEWASCRAAALMAAHAGATCARGVVDMYPKPAEKRTVTCRYQQLRDLIGIDVTPDHVKEVFEMLELLVVDSDDTACTVQVPTFRVDLEMETDLIEEFARIHGLDKIPLPSPKAEVVSNADDRPVQAMTICRENLIGLGLRESMNYSFVAEALLDLFDSSDKERRVVLPNPVSLEQGTMRPSLIPQMVETLGKNLAHQNPKAALFEMGRAFFLGDDGEPSEDDRLSIGLMGPVGRMGLESQAPVKADEMFLWLKGIWECLAASLGIQDVLGVEAECPYLEPGAALVLSVDGAAVGVMGLIAGRIRKEWRISEPIAALEVTLPAMLKHVFEGKTYAPIASYPSIVRDMAIIVDQSAKHEDVLKIVESAAPKELERVDLFDIFTGEGVGAGKQSLAYSLTYRSLKRTLTDEDANRYHETVKDALKKKLGVEIREG